jgi:hypothetical protein
MAPITTLARLLTTIQKFTDEQTDALEELLGFGYNPDDAYEALNQLQALRDLPEDAIKRVHEFVRAVESYQSFQHGLIPKGIASEVGTGTERYQLRTEDLKRLLRAAGVFKIDSGKIRIGHPTKGLSAQELGVALEEKLGPLNGTQRDVLRRAERIERQKLSAEDEAMVDLVGHPGESWHREQAQRLTEQAVKAYRAGDGLAEQAREAGVPEELIEQAKQAGRELRGELSEDLPQGWEAHAALRPEPGDVNRDEAVKAYRSHAECGHERSGPEGKKARAACRANEGSVSPMFPGGKMWHESMEEHPSSVSPEYLEDLKRRHPEANYVSEASLAEDLKKEGIPVTEEAENLMKDWELLESADAAVWAHEFTKRYWAHWTPLDPRALPMNDIEALMLSWFASAIETGKRVGAEKAREGRDGTGEVRRELLLESVRQGVTSPEALVDRLLELQEAVAELKQVRDEGVPTATLGDLTITGPSMEQVMQAVATLAEDRTPKGATKVVPASAIVIDVEAINGQIRDTIDNAIKDLKQRGY